LSAVIQRVALMALMLVGGLVEPSEAKRLVLWSAQPSSSLSSFLNSEADTLVVMPKRGGWVTGPLRLTRGHRVIVLMPGTEIRAAAGAFLGLNDALVTLYGVRDVHIIGYGARLVMRKAEYNEGQWRHALSLMGVQRVTVEGLALDSSGGDGIYVDGLRDPSGLLESRQVRIAHVTASGNRRQGISVISADDLLVEHSRFEGTSGHDPQAGIDFEPDHDGQRLVNNRIRNSVFAGNAGPPALIDLRRLSGRSEPVSITFEDCLFAATASSPGTLVRAYRGAITEGAIRFSRSTFRNEHGPTLTLRASVRGNARIDFESCLFDGRSTSGFLHDASPVIRLRETRRADNPSGIVERATFTNCHAITDRRPLLVADPLDAPVARDIKLDMAVDRAVAFGKPIPGVRYEPGVNTPTWPPPPPTLTFVGARKGHVIVNFATWSHDTVVVWNGTIRRTGPQVNVTAKAGDSIRSIACRTGLCSDTLNWVVPESLR
jgi:hypothetical protein